VHLVKVYERLAADLAKKGRTDWVAEEMGVLTAESTYRQDPAQAWERLRARARKPKELAVLMEVAAWREREAQARDVPRQRVIKDDTVAEIVTQAPVTPEKLAELRTLSKGFERSKWGTELIDAVKAGLARDPKMLPKLERRDSLPNGAAATVELLKVLLRMTSEKHQVAAKVIATTDDLEAIAMDDNADVGPLRGWRRDLFGELALALKHGRLALAIERGRVVALDRSATPPA
jgi:ribonuclease D